MLWRPTEKDIERFTCGDCHYLARAIHKLTGWSIAAFDQYGLADLHAFVLMPDMRVLDVKGARTQREITQEWSGWHPKGIIPCDWRDVEPFGSPAYGEYSVRRAREIAPRLVRQALDKRA